MSRRSLRSAIWAEEALDSAQKAMYQYCEYMLKADGIWDTNPPLPGFAWPAQRVAAYNWHHDQIINLLITEGLHAEVEVIEEGMGWFHVANYDHLMTRKRVLKQLIRGLSRYVIGWHRALNFYNDELMSTYS